LHMAAIRHEKAGDLDRAVEAYQHALKIDDERADVHYRLARCMRSLKRHQQAKDHYLRARDLDTLRFRADSEINEAIRVSASGRESDGIFFVDAEQALSDACEDGVPGDNLFHEHVHLNFSGNYMLARCIFAKLERVLPEWVRSQAKTQGEPL